MQNEQERTISEDPDFNVVEVDRAVHIDPLTGEIIPLTAEELSHERLPGIGRWLISLDGREDHLNNPRPAPGPNAPANACGCADCNAAREAKKHAEIVKDRKERITGERTKALGIAGDYVGAYGETNKKTGRKFIYFEGTGRFGFRKLPASLDCSVYNESDNATRGKLHSDRQGVFNFKTVVTPDKEVIKKRVQEGDELLASYFSIKTGEKFEFVKD